MIFSLYEDGSNFILNEGRYSLKKRAIGSTHFVGLSRSFGINPVEQEKNIKQRTIGSTHFKK